MAKLVCPCSNSYHRDTHLKKFNPLNAELNAICHLLALLGTHHILHVSRIRVKPHRKYNATYLLNGNFSCDLAITTFATIALLQNDKHSHYIIIITHKILTKDTTNITFSVHFTIKCQTSCTTLGPYWKLNLPL